MSLALKIIGRYCPTIAIRRCLHWEVSENAISYWWLQKNIHTMMYTHTVVYRHAYHLNVPSFVSSQWSKIWFQRPIWDRCLHDGRVSFLRGRSIQGILGFFWLYCTQQCGQMKHFGQDARNRQSELMISSNKLLLSNNVMPCHHLSIARLKTNTGKYSWLNLPLFATSVTETWHTCEGWRLTCWTCLDEKMWSRLLGMSGNMWNFVFHCWKFLD